MKRILLPILAILLWFPALADEGMWLPGLIASRIDDMRAKGFHLSAEAIYSINQASMKDAVVLFDGGCTGELVSSEGLLLTNHHCGYDAIQRHSSLEHDYLTDGFWARTREDSSPFVDRMLLLGQITLDGHQEFRLGGSLHKSRRLLVELIHLHISLTDHDGTDQDLVSRITEIGEHKRRVLACIRIL